jgi:hypothetical protein
MFNALVSLILFCTFWCKLYSLGIQVERQSVETNAEKSIPRELQLPELSLNNKDSWRVQDEHGSKVPETRKTRERTKSSTKKTKKHSTPLTIKKPQIRRGTPSILSTERKTKNDTVPLSKRLRNVLQALEEDDNEDKRSLLEGPEALQVLDTSVAKADENKMETPREEKTKESTKNSRRITPPSLNKRRRLIIHEQKGLSFLLEPSILSENIYEKRISTLYQKSDGQVESSKQTLAEAKSFSNSSVVREQSEDIQSNTNARLHTTSFPLQAAFELSPSPGLASIAFQSGQVSERCS